MAPTSDGWPENPAESLFRNYVLWDERRENAGWAFTPLLIGLAGAVIVGIAQLPEDLAEDEATLAVVAIIASSASIVAGVVRHAFGILLAEKMLHRLRRQMKQPGIIKGRAPDPDPEDPQIERRIQSRRTVGWLQGTLWLASGLAYVAVLVIRLIPATH